MKLLISTLFVFFITVYGEENKPLPCNCRLNNFNRIINGEIAKNHSIPWIVSLENKIYGHFCGGSIVNERYIMTAANCIGLLTAENITVHLGLQNLLNFKTKNIYNVANIITKLGSGDFALIKLDRPIEFEPGKIEPACLNLEDDNFYEDDLLIAGWGHIEKPWMYLNETMSQFELTPNKDGNLRYYFSSQTKTCRFLDICTIPKNEGASFCYGDFGVPLMHIKNGKTSIIGINSKPGYVEENEKLIACSGTARHIRLKKYKNFIAKIAGQYCSV